MSNKQQAQAAPCLSKKFITFDGPPKLSDKYIVICPAWFDQVLKDQLDFIDSIEVQLEGHSYSRMPEDVWMNKPEDEGYTADVWQHKGHCEKIIFVPHQGRLYSADNILDAATIIEEIKAAEALKLISND